MRDLRLAESLENDRLSEERSSLLSCRVAGSYLLWEIVSGGFGNEKLRGE